MRAHRNRVRAAQLSSGDGVGWCLTVFPAIRDLLVSFGGGAPKEGEFPGLNHVFPAGRRFGRTSAPPVRGSFGIFSAHRNRVRVAQLPYKRNFRWFGLLRLQFALYWSFGCPRGLFMGKFHGRPGPETGQKGRKSGFSRSWGPFLGQHPPTKFDRMPNAEPANPVWGPMCPWGPRYAPPPFFWGGEGHFVGWGPVLSVRDPTPKEFGPEKAFFFAVLMSLFSPKTERPWPLVPPIGAVRTEKA